jgi:cytochrome P450
MAEERRFDDINNFPRDIVNVDPYSIPLDQCDPANPFLFEAGVELPWFERLRKEDPVHYTNDSNFGPYWSVTRYEDIMAVDLAHDVFSSEPIITIGEPLEDFDLPMFIAMDRPKHDDQRRVVAPVVGPANLGNFEKLIRERTQSVLDDLPVGVEFDWVEQVSVELTTRMLATLFGFPYEDRARLKRWSDVATATPGGGIIDSEEQRREELLECVGVFLELWNQRVNQPPQFDFISMLAHGESTKNMDMMEYLGNLILLIVGGNDTTRNTMSASALAMHLHPDQFADVKADQKLIENMVSETIRWQTPLAHMRRRAKIDTVLGGKAIKEGDKVVMWYLSGNRDESVFPNANEFNLHRDNLRRHLAFGFGIHRCMGNRLAEMQLKILWEEILARFDRIEVVGEVQRGASVFVRGITQLPVKIHAKA